MLVRVSVRVRVGVRARARARARTLSCVMPRTFTSADSFLCAQDVPYKRRCFLHRLKSQPALLKAWTYMSMAKSGCFFFLRDQTNLCPCWQAQ